ncbi:hypothetical protein ENH_00031840 [Eimeria necatrix]|uniref:Uncharacterized protein n=1 Tax=Eimeria necatrix TaxID=51315 RepID=U6MXF7_9EIME|nr:hypothetical protein ENH_00031840 [Eimeria necatrix]CDJ67179.1 hypothetical protein ENH_00031840 [Eimeria necatrix]
MVVMRMQNVSKELRELGDADAPQSMKADVQGTRKTGHFEGRRRLRAVSSTAARANSGELAIVGSGPREREAALASAQQLFWDLRTWHKVLPDAAMFTVIMKMHARKKEAAKAFALLQDMLQSQVLPTDLTYTELLAACAAAKSHCREAFRVFDQLRASAAPMKLRSLESLEMGESLMIRESRHLGDTEQVRPLVQRRDQRQEFLIVDVSVAWGS